jgi:hypothetical protein
MKQCSRCRQWLPVGEFSVNRAKRDGLQNNCRTCQRDYVRGHYAANHWYYIDKAKRGKQKQRSAYRRLLVELKQVACMDCGGMFPPWAMDFDHVRGVKLFNLSRGSGRGRRGMLAEVSKCDIVCSNCHRDRTQRRLQAPIAQPG